MSQQTTYFFTVAFDLDLRLAAAMECGFFGIGHILYVYILISILSLAVEGTIVAEFVTIVGV
ncbi:MAG: hypothetical protein ABJX82_11230 [Paracoccaceae bacterium]